MSTATRWALAIVAVLLLVGLIGFARGEEHRRGQQIGALAIVESTGFAAGP